MLAAVEAGVNFFDTAPMYGDGASETLLGKFLAENSLRERTVIATKIRPDRMRPEEVMQECEDSLARLQTDTLDLYQTHWTSREVPIVETWGAMRRLQDQGKVRHIGVCNMGPCDLGEIAPLAPPKTNQLPLNLLWRMIESEILPECIRQEIGVLVYSPLMHGILADKYPSAADVPDGRARTRHFSSTRALTRHNESGCESETFAALAAVRQIANDLQRSMAEVALAWLLGQTGVVSVIAGASTPQQLQVNLQSVDQPLTSEVLERLSEVTAPLKTALGSNPDMWDSGDNARFR